MLLTVLSLSSLLGYLLTNKRAYRYVWKSRLDDKVPLLAIFVLPYLGLFPYIVISYATLQSPQLNLFMLAILICNILASIFWYCWPNGVPRTMLNQNKWSHRLINHLYRHDGDTNGFPSAHVFLSTICTYYLSMQYTSWSALFIIAGSAIAISTVLVKQHYLVDIIGGLLFAAVSVWASQYFFAGVV